jgi:microsomal dipeptidase-like Zn-dependent dipeptidase
MIIDVANMNNQSMIETYRYSKRPIINSHTAVLSLHQDQRNVSDEFLDWINPTDGLIGLSLNADLMV